MKALTLPTLAQLLLQDVNVESTRGTGRGRGRPRKVVNNKQGIYINTRADKKSDWKQLIPKDFYEIRQAYNKILIKYPNAKMAGIVTKISKDFGLVYSQAFDIVNGY